MEGKRHASTAHQTNGEISRMQQDFQVCSQTFSSTPEKRLATREKHLVDQKRKRVSTNRPLRPIRVGIVGGGLAGLRSAEVLLSEGCEVTILEGRDRLGGRLRQEHLDGKPVDLGASWIHGTKNNPLLKLAHESNTLLSFVDESTFAYDSQGTQLNQDKINTAMSIVWQIIIEAFQYSNLESQTIQPDISLRDFFEEKLVGSAPGEREFILSLAETWGFFIGSPWEKQSLKWFWLEECLDGDNILVVSSHQALLQKLISSVADRARVLLSSVVTNIEHLNPHNQEDPKILVRTESESFEFDEVIIAVPLGCLKSNQLALEPSLPSNLSLAIKNASYGALEKVYIAFPKDFWTNRHGKANVASPPPTPLGLEAQSFRHFVRPQYVPEEQASWTIELIPMPSTYHIDGHVGGLLLFTLHGPAATHVTTLITGLCPENNVYNQTLTEFFRPYYSLLPNYSEDEPGCKPTGALATNWQNDALAGHGSYTNFQVSPCLPEGGNQANLDDDIRLMRHGMPDRGIWFAGEHTAPFVAVGTPTGAYWSGESAAVRILVANSLL